MLQRRLLVVTGKGGVGKTTIAAALGLEAAGRGLRTIVVELGDQRRLPGLFADAASRADGRAGADSTDAGAGADSTQAGAGEGAGAGEETALAKNLWSVTIDPDKALLQWLQALGGRVPGRVLASSGTFQYFAAAAPGAQELVSMVKIWELTRADRWRRRAQRYDLVVLDAPATGHALGLLHSPRTFGAIARVGPIFGQAERVRELLEDPAQTGYLAVTQPTEMAVGETLDLQAGLRSQLGRELRRRDRQRDAAAPVRRTGDGADRTPGRTARQRDQALSRGWPRAPCTSGRASSTTRSRACAVMA